VVSEEVAEFSSFMANAERKLAEEYIHQPWLPALHTASRDEGSLPWSDFPPLTGGKFVKRRWFRRADFKTTKKKPEININIEKLDLTGTVNILPLMNPKKCCKSRDATECPLSPEEHKALIICMRANLARGQGGSKN
jgi:hypothetical protein